jgi:hypothetical protein
MANKDSLMCILCERLRGRVGDNKCVCTSVTYCKSCDEDNLRHKTEVTSKRDCKMHGSYRDYEDLLNTTKNYIMILVAFIMLVVALFLYNINLSLNWLYLFMGILVGPGRRNQKLNLLFFLFFLFIYFLILQLLFPLR